MTPEQEQRKYVAFCPHCGNRTPQRIAFEHTYRATWYGSDGKPLDWQEGPNSEAILCVCETCNAVLLYDGIEYSETGLWPELVHPRNSTLPIAVPELIRDIYHEAAIVKQNAPNAFAILIRKGLEAICDEKGAAKGTLEKRLSFLVSRGDIPPVLAELTEVLRVVGNSAAHSALQSITAPMTWAIDEFFRTIIEYVYVAPSKVTAFRKRLAELK